MWSRLFPAVADNRFTGHPAALWCLVPLLLLRAVQGVNSIVMTERVARGADGIPLETFPADAAAQVLQLFALLGADRLVVAATCAIVALRYRSLVPLLYLGMLGEILLKQVVLQMRPTGTELAPAGLTVTLGIVALLVVGLVSSLVPRRASRQR